MNQDESKNESIIANKYKLLKPLGQGSCGSIYQGENIRTGEIVAIKMESASTYTGLLKHETKIYQYLNICCKKDDDEPVHGIPRVRWFGRYEDNYYMVIDMLGNSLNTIKERKGCFSLQTISQVGTQIVQRLSFLHDNGLVHRDVKPANFLLGPPGKERIIHLIDYGFCKRRMNGRHETMNGDHKKRTAIIGTPNFISVGVHLLNEPDVMDDLESVGYMLIYFYLDKLPWDTPGLSLDSVMIAKMELLTKREMWEKTIPPAFLDFIQVVQTGDEESFDYNELIEILRRLA
jgi:serine/threonine protein kinase